MNLDYLICSFIPGGINLLVLKGTVSVISSDPPCKVLQCPIYNGTLKTLYDQVQNQNSMFLFLKTGYFDLLLLCYVRKIQSPKIYKYNPHMASSSPLLTVTSYEVFTYLSQETTFSRTLERIESNQPYFTTLLINPKLGSFVQRRC